MIFSGAPLYVSYNWKLIFSGSRLCDPATRNKLIFGDSSLCGQGISSLCHQIRRFAFRGIESGDQTKAQITQGVGSCVWRPTRDQELSSFMGNWFYSGRNSEGRYELLEETRSGAPVG